MAYSLPVYVKTGFLFYQHRVAKTVKAVVIFNCRLVSAFN